MERRIAILVDSRETQGRSLFKGAAGVLQSRTIPFRLHDVLSPPTVRELRTYRGIIAQVRTHLSSKRLGRLRMPVVNVSNTATHLDMPRVGIDDIAVGRTAVEFLKSAGYRRLLLISGHGSPYIAQREAGFRAAAANAGIDARVVMFPATNREAWLENHLPPLLHSPAPIGVVGHNDKMARLVAEHCAAHGIDVPRQVGILGVDDDELTVFSSPIPLSSVAIPVEQVGRRAATLLLDLMDGAPSPDAPILFPPQGVVRRTSTALLPLQDALVAQALQYIMAHATEPIGVDDVVAVVPSGRRRLEQRFQEAIGESIGSAIQRHRMDRVRELLTRSNLTIKEIAARCSFGNAQWLAVSFRKATGMTPSEYRRAYAGVTEV